MIINSVQIENFLSIENLSIDFRDLSSLILLDGWNNDHLSANGSGKSSVLNAISYAIFEDFPRKITSTEIQRIGTKKTKVTVELSVGDQNYKVTRSRPGGPLFFKADQEISQDEFQKSIKLNYDQFTLAQYFPQTTSSFLDLPDAGRKELLLKLIDADCFSRIKQNLDAQVKQIQSEITPLQSQILKLKTEKQTKEELLSTTPDPAQEKSTLLEKITTLESKKTPFSPTDLTPLLKKKAKAEEVISGFRETQAEIRLKQKIIAQNKTQKVHKNDPIPCPLCQGNLTVASGHIRAHTPIPEPYDFKEENAALGLEIEELTKSIEKLPAYQDALEKINTAISESKSKEELHSQRQKQINDRLSDLNQQLSSLDKAVDRINALRDSIQSLASSLNDKNQLLKSLESELIVHQQAQSVVSPTGIPAYLLDAVVEDLNSEVSENIQAMFPTASYSIQTFKENKSGSVVAKISESLVINGHKRSIGSLSGGEKRCISLAVDFAIHSIAQRYLGQELSPLFLDEPFESVDERGQNLAMKLIEKKAEEAKVVVVSHLPEIKSQFHDTILIEKTNGISTRKQ
jgi:DNA repair exonuclease SbcCD ATPase subunit